MGSSVAPRQTCSGSLLILTSEHLAMFGGDSVVSRHEAGAVAVVFKPVAGSTGTHNSTKHNRPGDTEPGTSGHRR
jgi:hypothetical protein